MDDTRPIDSSRDTEKKRRSQRENVREWVSDWEWERERERERERGTNRRIDGIYFWDVPFPTNAPHMDNSAQIQLPTAKAINFARLGSSINTGMRGTVGGRGGGAIFWVEQTNWYPRLLRLFGCRSASANPQMFFVARPVGTVVVVRPIYLTSSMWSCWAVLLSVKYCI